MAKQVKVEIDYNALGELCLRSENIANMLMKEANAMRGRYGKRTKCRLKKQYGKRYRVYIDSSYADASKNNDFLKSVK